MKLPNQIRTYCPHCRKHTIHKLKEYKKGQRRSLAIGQRKALRKMQGYGANKIKAHKVTERVKQNVKPTFIATCTECGKKRYFVIPKRMKKVELVSMS